MSPPAAAPACPSRHRIETMNAPTLSQVFLVERDANLMCRILGLYAARSLDVLHVGYGYAAKDVMKLDVLVARNPGEDTADTVRVLVDKAATFIGVLAACEQEAPAARRMVEPPVFVGE
jgi:hypothetical protein